MTTIFSTFLRIFESAGRHHIGFSAPGGGNTTTGWLWSGTLAARTAGSTSEFSKTGRRLCVNAVTSEEEATSTADSGLVCASTVFVCCWRDLCDLVVFTEPSSLLTQYGMGLAALS